MESIETLILGGGQAGLALSHCLGQRGAEHLVLEQSAQPGNAWRNDRWDSFTLVTPNWSVTLPDGVYAGPDPDGFMTKNELVAYFERYASSRPVRYGVRATSVDPREDGGISVQVEVDGQTERYNARNVVVATGLYQRPKMAPFAANLPLDIAQMGSGQYRNPGKLPDGAVVVIGASQSGLQIAEELFQAGREVYLCAGFSPRVPRRYRGKDIFHWMILSGWTDRTPDKLPSPRMRLAPNPALTGKDNGHTLDLRAFARNGIHVLGRAESVDGATLRIQPGLNETLARIDRTELEMCALIDAYIAREGIDAPAPAPLNAGGPEIEEVASVDLRAAGVTSIIWANGYSFDFDLVHAPIFDDMLFPVQTRGVTAVPGLYFLGLPWLRVQRSGLLCGVADDAEWLAERIARTR